jgi:hypothetical protein
MNNLEITISWEYFLGIITAIIAFAWYAGTKFSKLETAIDWMSKSIDSIIHEMKEMRIDIEVLKRHIK